MHLMTEMDDGDWAAEQKQRQQITGRDLCPLADARSGVSDHWPRQRAILRGLAERVKQLAVGAAICAQLQSADDASGQAWPKWRAVAHHWDIASTGAPTPPRWRLSSRTS
jgi:hypothetical protein